GARRRPRRPLPRRATRGPRWRREPARRAAACPAPSARCAGGPAPGPHGLPPPAARRRTTRESLNPRSAGPASRAGISEAAAAPRKRSIVTGVTILDVQHQTALNVARQAVLEAVWR